MLAQKMKTPLQNTLCYFLIFFSNAIYLYVQDKERTEQFDIDRDALLLMSQSDFVHVSCHFLI